MIKKLTIEKIYLFIVIMMLGLWGGTNMLMSEHESIASDDSPMVKVTLGLLFLLLCIYLLINYKYIHLDSFGRRIGILSIYMAIARIAVLPPSVGMLSYFYQPMLCIVIFLLYIMMVVIVYKSDELREYFATFSIVTMFIIAFFYLKNWTYVNSGSYMYHLGTVYWIMFSLPMVLYSSKKWLHYVGIIIVTILLFSSLKRGGIMAFVLGMMAYLVVKYVFIRGNFKYIIFFCFALCLFFILLVVMNNVFDNTLFERFLDITNDGGSGRINVWNTTWQMICNSRLEYLIFGHGYNTVVLHSPLALSAHNDILEALYDYGILGSIFYMGIHIMLIKQIFRGIRNKNQYTPIWAFTYTFFFVLTMVSHVLIYPWMTFMALAWGIGNSVEHKTIQQ